MEKYIIRSLLQIYVAAPEKRHCDMIPNKNSEVTTVHTIQIFKFICLKRLSSRLIPEITSRKFNEINSEKRPLDPWRIVMTDGR